MKARVLLSIKQSYATDTNKKVHRRYLRNSPNTGFVELPLRCWENSDRDEMGLILDR